MKSDACKTTGTKAQSCKALCPFLPLFLFRLLVFSFSLLGIFLNGCSVIVAPYILSKGQAAPYDVNLSDCYYSTQLKKSGALNVIPIINKRQNELLSQGRCVVASLGQSEDGFKVWFNMVAFDEVTLTARRKYFFLVDEKVGQLPYKPNHFLMEPKRGLMFDCQLVMDKTVLDISYGSENARQISILRQVLKSLHKDIASLGQGADVLGSDNKKLSISGLLLNQVFNSILLNLDKSPVLVSKLSEESGVDFDHINFGKGNIQMKVEADIVTVRIRLGVFVHPFQSKTQQSAGKTQDTEPQSAVLSPQTKAKGE